MIFSIDMYDNGENTVFWKTLLQFLLFIFNENEVSSFKKVSRFGT